MYVQRARCLLHVLSINASCPTYLSLRAHASQPFAVYSSMAQTQHDGTVGRSTLLPCQTTEGRFCEQLSPSIRPRFVVVKQRTSGPDRFAGRMQNRRFS